MARTTPPPFEPMRAVAAEDVPTDDDAWSYEIKWDGMRVLATVADGTTALRSVNGLDATGRFPALGGLGTALAGHEAVLDGEVVALGDDGRPDFGRLQRRDGPVVLVLFDLLALDGRDLRALPYEERRALLRTLVPPGPAWKVTEAWTGGGRALLEAMAEQGLEGLVAKRLGSAYESGRRSRAWRKLKVRARQELVVGGWLPGKGARAATFGALLVGYHEPAGGPLRYAGRVGTGFTDAELVRVRAELDGLPTDACPFEPDPPRPVSAVGRWVRPELVVEVAFAEWTGDGLLRHPSYRGPRLDKQPAEVVREPGPAR